MASSNDESWIDLSAALDALRAELADAAERSKTSDLQFPVEEVVLEFNVAVTKSVDGTAGIKFWVAELGTTASASKVSTQKVVVKLGSPMDRSGDPLLVDRELDYEP